MSLFRQTIWLGSLCAAFSLAPGAAAAPLGNVIDRAAMRVVDPEKKVMLDLTTAGARVVGVGEHGLVVLSDDGGKSWRQARVPTSVTLTAVRFANAQTGWAIGHAGVILRSDDGGATWRKQLDGRAIAALVQEAARTDPALQASARQLSADGPDKPLLSMVFRDERNGIVTGAYGLALQTTDGGAHWTSLMQNIDNPKGLHLYAVVAAGDMLWLAGEQGFLARSTDGGKRFVQQPSPYAGSWFALVPAAGGEVVLGGLKGNAYRTREQGTRFEKIAGFTPASISAAARSGDGRMVFVNQAGQVQAGADGGAVALVPQAHPNAPFAAILPLGGGALAAGARGVTFIDIAGRTAARPGAAQ